MADFPNYTVSQREADQCLASAVTSIARHFAAERGGESPLEDISLSKVGDVIAPQTHVELPVRSVVPHSDHPEDDLNHRLLQGTPVFAVEKTDADLDFLKMLISDDMKSLPIVTVHPDYFEWQGVHNDDKAVYRHAIVVKKIEDGKVKIWDPIEKMYSDRVETYKLETSVAELLDFWNKTLSQDPLNTPTPKQVMWFEDRGSEDPEQKRLE